MHVVASIVVFQAFASSALAACNANNCARAVTGTFRSMVAARQSDCSTNLACTVTPAVSTVYVTTSIVNPPSTGTPSFPVKPATTVCGSSIPTYAAACSSVAAYSSACSCGSATAPTGTVATPVTTVTVTSAGPGPECSTYVLQATSGPFSGQYLRKVDNGGVGISASGGRSLAVPLLLDGTTARDLSNTDQALSTVNPDDSSIYFVPGYYGWYPLIFNIASTYAPGTSGRPVTISTPNAADNISQTCGNTLYINTSAQCPAVNFIAIPACS